MQELVTERLGEVELVKGARVPVGPLNKFALDINMFLSLSTCHGAASS